MEQHSTPATTPIHGLLVLFLLASCGAGSETGTDSSAAGLPTPEPSGSTTSDAEMQTSSGGESAALMPASMAEAATATGAETVPEAGAKAGAEMVADAEAGAGRGGEGTELDGDATPDPESANEPEVAAELDGVVLADTEWMPLELKPFDCSEFPSAGAVALAADFSSHAEGDSTTHTLVMDVGSMVRRTSTYVTTENTSEHQHQLFFDFDALDTLLMGVSIAMATDGPPVGMESGHGHLVTVRSCGAYY